MSFASAWATLRSICATASSGRPGRASAMPSVLQACGAHDRGFARRPPVDACRARSASAMARGVVPGAKGEPAHLLEQVRALDRVAVRRPGSPARRRSRPARSRSPASQCRPPILRSTRAARARSSRRLRRLLHAVVGQRLGAAPAGRAGRRALARGQRLARRRRRVGERAQDTLVVADRVVVGVDGARPVAGGQQVGAPRSLSARGSSDGPAPRARRAAAAPRTARALRARGRRAGAARCAAPAAGSGRPPRAAARA